MELSDFDYNEDNFGKDLRRAEVGFKRGKTYFLDLVDHWQRFIDAKLSSDIVLKVDPGSDMATGVILGKQFALHLSQVSRGEHGLTAVLLTLNDRVNKSELELDRFYLNARGEVLSKTGELLLSSQEDDSSASIRLFYAILLRVLKAEPWA
ncbi:hypothetical protein U8291_16235 [Pseudomonas sp. A2]|uniref:hypothetical protein n=1 Tax=Pseudomonas sp. A2 TaxID=107445 RepID=UPI002ACC4F5B|nr:hypothetical protein [Pseudomonas sp. A2]MEB3438562.1 hypothetical protein [Pseudomonas sp. A2]HEN8732251.1 hypothetical protein [Pseudomonas putida]